MSPFIEDRILAAVLYIIGATLVARFARSRGARPAVYIPLAVFYPIAYAVAGTYAWIKEVTA